MANGEDEDWEYEYDENETEDFYITVDLSNIPEKGDAHSSGGKIVPMLSGHPILLQSRLRALNAVRRHEGNAIDASAGEDSSMGKMQITGLHTPNPLIMYNDQLLSCEWASSIGTDMFFVKPKPHTGSNEHPLRSLPAVDLLAISSAKLMATPARLRPRDEAVDQAALNKEQSGTRTDLAPDTQVRSGQTEGEAPRVAANSFLERLNQAKAKRGEKSRLVVSSSGDETRLEAVEDVEMGGTEEHG
jgi:hypothetical protein